MASSHFRSFFSLFAVIAIAFTGYARSIGAFVSEVVAVAFPAPATTTIISRPIAVARVLGLSQMRSFRDRVISRMGDPRSRSDLSAAFIAA